MNCDVLNIKLENTTVYKQYVTLFDSITANTVIRTPKYGRLYNWYAAINPKLAPAGWHVPSSTELTDLITYLGGAAAAGPKVRDADTKYWGYQTGGLFPENNNSSRFSLRGCGLRSFGTFAGYGSQCQIWAYTEYNPTQGYCASTWWNYAEDFVISGTDKKRGSTIRFIKDTQDWTEGETVRDLEGTVYPTIKIGNQVWLAANWCCTKYNDGTEIQNITDDVIWAALTSEAYCNYDNDESYVFDITNYVTVTDKAGDTLTNTQLYNSVRAKPMLVNRIVFSSNSTLQKYNSLKCIKSTITGEVVEYNVNFYEYVNPLYPNNVIEINLKEPILINAEEFLAMNLEANSETSILLEFCQETTGGIVQNLLDNINSIGGWGLGYNPNDIIHIDEDSGVIETDNKKTEAGMSCMSLLLILACLYLAYKTFKK